jgi:hypothetical protein
MPELGGATLLVTVWFVVSTTQLVARMRAR